MFFNLPPLKLGEGENLTHIRVLSSRQTDDEKTTNIDFVNVTTGVGSDDEKTTHFGIQGRSDHLSAALAGEEKQSTASA